LRTSLSSLMLAMYLNIIDKHSNYQFMRLDAPRNTTSYFKVPSQTNIP